MKKLFLILACAMTLLTGCEKVVEFEVDDLETKVVLNGIPCVDSTLFVNVTYSRFFLDNSQYLPAIGADITMWVNGVEMSSNAYDGGNYFFPYQVQGGDSLRIRVALEGREPLEAGTRVPFTPVLDSVMALIDTTQIITNMMVKFQLQDPMGENYYRFYLTEHQKGSRWNAFYQRRDTIDTVGHAYFLTVDPDLVSPEATATESLMGFYGELLCSDKFFDGMTKQVTLAVMQVPDTSESEDYVHEYTLHVESISKDYYRYLCDVANAASIMSYFAEPTELYTNIKGGLGIFAGESKRTVPLAPIYYTPEEQTKGVRRR